MEGIIGYLFGLAIGIIGLVVAVYIIAEDGGGCFAFGVAIICAITTALNATMIVTGQRINKILKIEAIVVGILTTILAIASIFGPLLYPNINLFTHLFK